MGDTPMHPAYMLHGRLGQIPFTLQGLSEST